MGKRIYITAVNSVSALGIGFDKIASGLKGDKNISSVKDFEFYSFDKEVPAFKITDFEPKEILGRKGLRTKDHATKFLLATFEEGFKSIYDSIEDSTKKPGVVLGTSFGSVQSVGDFLSDSLFNGVNAVNPMLFANTVLNSPTGNVNIRYDVKSLSTTMATGFNSGIDAVIYATDYIKRGYIDSIVVGGFDEVSYYEILGFKKSGILSESGEIKPFSKDADGVVVGEGAAAFLIETEESAKAAGRKPIAEIVSSVSAFDPNEGGLGYNVKGEGARYVMKRALEDASLSATDIDFVASDANGVRSGDLMEAEAIASVLGDTPVTAYKDKLGETYGGASTLAMACALSDMDNGTISGVSSDYDAVAGINLVKGVQEKESKIAMINAFSCDGNCASLILKKIN